MNLWEQRHAATIDMDRFRGHDQYLEQAPWYPYEAMTAWAGVHAPVCLLRMKEDDAFGCVALPMARLTVSRDLLDSIAELHFIKAICGLTPARVLDIGAGYGRLAHRMTEVDTDVFVYCTDAIAVSRLACAKYLAHRGVTRGAVVLPSDLGKLPPIDLAVNVHSWSECSMADVCGWLDWVTTARVGHLFIVPHTPAFGVYSEEHGGGNGPTYLGELHARGWEQTGLWNGPGCCPRTYSMWEAGT